MTPRRRVPPRFSLAHVWGSRVRRVLFFTYRFNCQWFHDRVLSPLNRRSLDGTLIDVIATRFSDEPSATPVAAYGDLYALDEWAKWRGRLRVHYLPHDHYLFHNKFIVIERADGRLELGVGSSNLTNAGWANNFETWTWARPAALHRCADFLAFLWRIVEVNRDVLRPWLTRLPRRRGASAQVPWLFGDKASARREAFRSLTHGLDRPTVLRVVSPYFDQHSSTVLEELTHEIRAHSAHPRRTELWVDGSRLVARQSDYAAVLKLVGAQDRQVQVRTVLRHRGKSTPPEALPLHAKLIELEDGRGNVRRLVGSPNFTGAAWLEAHNTESIYQESDTQGLPALLPPTLEATDLAESDLRRLRASAEEDDPNRHDGGPCIYWATFDETARPRTLAVCYSHEASPLRVELHAAFHPIRNELPGLDRREAIVKAFETAANWERLPSPRGLVRLAFRSNSLVPERARVVLHFDGGKKLDAPIEIVEPDFDHRDPHTGIPLDASIDALAGAARPIVPPVGRRSTSDMAADVTNIDDEEEFVEPPRETLARDPDYQKQPIAVRLAKELARGAGDKTLLRIMGERFDACLAVPISPADRVVVTALRTILRGGRL